jgi:CheY-like chemotaxis protein
MAIRGATVGMHDKRLLVCDDEPRFGRFVKNVAEDLGYTVCVTTGGHAFIDAYGSFNPTTIVLDMIMPGMDGNELVLWLAQQKSTARLIIITGYTPDYAANAKVLAEYKGLGPVITLRKPVEFYELREVLKSA